MTIEKHLFNGEMLTTVQIKAIVPCLRLESIRAHLRAGRNTTQAMLCHVKAKPKPGPGSQFFIGKSPGYKGLAPSNMR